MEMGSGVGLIGLTFLALLILKLGGWAEISWFWVFFPLMLGAGVVAAVLLVFGVVALAWRMEGD